MSNTTAKNQELSADHFVFDQLRLECLAYNRVVGSFNSHLRAYRDRLHLDDLPYREPVTVPGDIDEMEALLAFLLDQVYLDSRVRRHPRIAPVHLEAVEQIELARRQLISTLEGEVQFAKVAEDDIRVA